MWGKFSTARCATTREKGRTNKSARRPIESPCRIGNAVYLPDTVERTPRVSDNRIESGIALAELVLPASNLAETLHFFIYELGFRLDAIAPADDPEFAQLSGHGLRLRLDADYRDGAATLRLGLKGNARREALTAPNGTRIEFEPVVEPVVVPDLPPGLSIQRYDEREDVWKTGRAGMQYRDLIPDRCGGRFIASHIRIPRGGPVADDVHYHEIHFQLIYCRRGWVRLVYEDQGEPFVMRVGDCVLQPPRIRHRVLEAADNLEVVEFTSPARHLTRLDHDMRLPTGRHLSKRDYDGQKFVFHRAATAQWRNGPEPGFEMRDLGIAQATKGLAAARVIRRGSVPRPADTTSNQGKAFAFAFVLQGRLALIADAQPETELTAGDVFAMTNGMECALKDCSDDLELLEITLPA